MIEMNIEQARTKLAQISGGTATKHPKVLVSELCVVVKFVLDELDRIKSHTVSLLPKRLPEDPETQTYPSIQPPWPHKPNPLLPLRNPSVSPKDKQMGNAGDAE